MEEHLTRGGTPPKASAAQGEATPAARAGADSAPGAAFACRVCGNREGNRGFVAREMMQGSRERFDYVECGDCGALQIRLIPDDLGRFYRGGYYAFVEPYRSPPLKRWAKRRIAAHLLGRGSLAGALLARRHRAPELDWVRRAGLGRDARILDVGAGSGQVLLTLWDYGFRSLLGVDPFLERDLAYPGGIRILSAGIEQVDGSFDLVMLHHSFEHVPDPERTLAAAGRRLAPGGRVLVRMPIAAASWRRYGADWVELDAPRHLHVHTERSFRDLAARVGLRVDRVAYDTDAFEIWGSEQYQRDIPLSDPRSHAPGGAGTVFGPREMAAFEARARELNRSGEAGRAAFWLVGR